LIGFSVEEISAFAGCHADTSLKILMILGDYINRDIIVVCDKVIDLFIHLFKRRIRRKHFSLPERAQLLFS
jgi:hypothetical protein